MVSPLNRSLGALFLGALVLLSQPGFALAQAASPPPEQFGEFEYPLPGLGNETIDTILANQQRPLGFYINIVVNVITALIVAIGVIMIVFGGYLYMTAGGSGDRVQAAKAYILAALTGIILALTAYTILNTLNPQLVNPVL